MFGRSFVFRRGRRSNQNSNIVPSHLLCTGTMAPEYGNHDARQRNTRQNTTKQTTVKTACSLSISSARESNILQGV